MRAIALLSLCGLGIAEGQVGFGIHAIEVSTDGGATWQGGIVEVEPGPRSVMVRNRFSWTGVPEAYAFASAQFDMGVFGAGAGDEVTEVTRVHPYIVPSQTVVAMRFGSVIKIDDSRDTLPFGMGTRGAFPGQPIENFAPPGGFVAENPAVPLVFTLHLDGEPGDRFIDVDYTPPSHGGPWAGGFRAYTSPAGARTGFYVITVALPYPPNARIETATVRVVPGPGAAGVLAVGLIALRRPVRA